VKLYLLKDLFINKTNFDISAELNKTKITVERE